MTPPTPVHHEPSAAPPQLHLRRFVGDFSPLDALALGALVGFVVLLWTYPRTPVIEDFWYHLALGHWIAVKKELFLTDPISFQPFGRPQLYPLLTHVLVALGELISRSAIIGSILIRILFYVGNLAAVWWVGRRLASPAAGLIALIIVGTDQSVFYTGWSLMPAGIIGIALVALTLLVERKRWVAAGIVAGAAAYTHLALPWFVFLGLAILAWSRPEDRRGLLRTLTIGVAAATPFLAFVIAHLDAFWTEKAVNFNPIPGFGPFGYASHYHVATLVAIVGGLGVAHLLLPHRHTLATLLGLGPIAVAVLNGRDDLPAAASGALTRLGLSVELHPLTFVNIGSVVAIVTVVAFAVLGFHRLAPSRTRILDAALGAVGAILAVAASALAFHVEVAQHQLWDALALGLMGAALTASWAAVLWITPLSRKPPLLVSLSCALAGLFATAAAPALSITVNASTLLEAVGIVALTAALGAAVALGLQRLRPTHPLTGSSAATIAFLLGLLPMLPLYGGRYLWHVTPLLALAGVLHLRRENRSTHQTLVVGLLLLACAATLAYILIRLDVIEVKLFDLGDGAAWLAVPVLLVLAALVAALTLRRGTDGEVKVPAPILLLIGGYALMLLLVRWPLFAYSRGWRVEFKPQSPPVFMALEAAPPAEYEQPDFLEMISWVEENVPPDAIVHTDDPRTAHQVTIFTDRVADNGMFWEAQTQHLQDLVAAERIRGRGAYVYTVDLPSGVPLQRTIGKWKVAWVE